MRSVLLFSTFLLLVLAVNAKKNNAATSTVRTVNIDLQQEIGPLNTMFKECIGAGRANEGLRADWQQQLAFVKNECGFKYIRMHGLLTDDMGVYKEDAAGNPE